jgi:hypothetical protein
LEAAKAAALHVAETSNDRLADSPGAFHVTDEALGGGRLARKVAGLADVPGRDRAD